MSWLAKPARAAMAALVLLAPLGPAQGTFKQAWRQFQMDSARLDAQERAFWKEFPRAQREAHTVYEKEWMDNWGAPDSKTEVHYVFDGYRKLYDEHLARIQEQCAAIATLGGYGQDGLEALTKLHDKLLQRAASLDKALRGAKPKQAFNYFDQRAGMERAGVDRLLDATLAALAASPGEGCAAELAGHWEKAEKTDRRAHSVERRRAILETLARWKADETLALARTALEDPNICARVMAMDALALLPESDEARALVLEHLDGEEQFPVVVSALRIWRNRTWTDSRAIPPLVALFAAEVSREGGLMRLHYMEALRAISGVDHGLSPTNWEGWMEKNGDAIRAGTYEPPKPEEEEEGKGDDTGTPDGDGGKTPVPASDVTVVFYNVKSFSRRMIFLVDASDTLMLPADIEVAKQKPYWQWRTGANRDLEGIKTQLDRLIEECEKTIHTLAPDCHFNVVLMLGDYRKLRFQPQLVPATDANKAAALAFLRKARPHGWASQLSGIRDAMEMAGMPPDADDFTTATCDTIFLLSDGVPCGGFWMDSREIVNAFVRLNRYRNMTVHSIRIANELKDDAEVLMKGIADASGGTYVWHKK